MTETSKSSKHESIPTPMTEEQILASNVGTPTVLNQTVLLVDYEPEWPRLFEREETRIRAALGELALSIEHVGSTSVPGLAAKPKIDILLVVANSADESTYFPALEESGYILKIREPDWYEHRMFKGPDIDVNLHVFSQGCEEIERMLLFRNWLRNNADDRQLYEQTKRELAKRTWKYMQNYADAKSAVVAEIMTRARNAAQKI
ncbi:MAG TPA: GrpB family protein [Anaerolineales bacterium]|nr:GrpB family protein [Anaerolineales bacterium]